MPEGYAIYPVSSNYAGDGDEKGKVMGIFRSLGSLARALGPLVACTGKSLSSCCVYWMVASSVSQCLCHWGSMRKGKAQAGQDTNYILVRQ